MPSIKINPKLNKTVYSTNEIKTNKVWIDGKPIYRKVYTGNAVKSGKVILEDDISFIDTIINAYGTAKSQYGWNWIIPNFSSGYEVLVRMSDDTDDLQIYFGSNYTTSQIYKAVVEYTKTTD